MSVDPAQSPALEACFRLTVGSGARAFALDVDLALARGVLVLFGPSGAGKSLTLQVLAGLLAPSWGSIRVGGEALVDVDGRIAVPAHRRRIGYVPQHHALFPFLDVIGNVAFGLPRAERRSGSARVAALLDELGLTRLSRARPGSLSGGERQRVALARALAVEPRLLLLDEPFASIDHEGRAALRAQLREVIDRRGVPAVFVTHDAEEARILGDRVARFDRGRTVASGSPADLLGGARRVTITGEAIGPPDALPEGRARVMLRAAIVEGPADVLAAASDGALRFELRADPAFDRS